MPSRHESNIIAAKEAADQADIKADALLAHIATMTTAQAAAYIDNQVTTLASAKNVLKAFAKIIVIMARKIT